MIRGFLLPYFVATLCLATFATSHEHQTTVTTSKPYIHRPVEHKFTTLLSIDGGGTKSIIPVMSLVALENAIKSYILHTKPELLPSGSAISTIDEFEISLADYLDVVTGTAAGGWIAFYIASRGETGTLSKILQDPEVISQYGDIAPGSAKALIVFFYEFSFIIFPQAPPPNAEAPTAEAEAAGPAPADPLIPGVNIPLYPGEGVAIAMDALFGNITLADLTTTCLIPMLDLETSTVVTMVYDDLQDDHRFGFTDFMFANSDNPLLEIITPDIMFRGGIDFLVKDIAVASSAEPTLLPSINVTSVSGPETRFLGSDGFLGVAGNPTFLALAYVANRTETHSLENYAILSIGSGTTIGFYEDNANGGVVQWFATNELLEIVLNLSGNDFSSQLDLLFSANPDVAFNQYLRIQTFADVGTKEGDLLARIDRPTNLPELQQLGEELAANFSMAITGFVQDFIFS